MKKALAAVGIQYAALPYRMAGRHVEILLVTSRETRRWVIPKGWPMKGMSPAEAAAAEAAEEAGITGEAEAAIGSYRYMKRLKKGEAVPAQVIVFPFHVTGHSEKWKEEGQRDLHWFRAPRAASLVAEPSLKRLIREFARARSRRLFAAPPSLRRLVDKGLLFLRG